LFWDKNKKLLLSVHKYVIMFLIQTNLNESGGKNNLWNELFFPLHIDQTDSVSILCQFVQTTCVCYTGYWTVPNYYYSITMCRFCVHFLQQKECNTQLLNRLLLLETLLSLTENQVQGFCTYVWGMRHKRPTLRSQLLHRVPTLWYN